MIVPLAAAYMAIGFFCINIVLYALIGTNVTESPLDDFSSYETTGGLSFHDES